MFFLLAALACVPPTSPVNVADTDLDLHLPTSEAFTFGPGDALRIWVWRHDDLSVDVTVAPDGAIAYPLVGRIVSGHESAYRYLPVSVDHFLEPAELASKLTAAGFEVRDVRRLMFSTVALHVGVKAEG